ncbi:MAG: proton-conducting transporter membrane subunit [Parachlamydiales bacterium]|jgi:formate hydrogenlyase subunit 3/multisubunit Na+/H+ antiporter MnhD subunit
MGLMLLSLALLSASALVALSLNKRPLWASKIGSGGLAIAAFLGLIPAWKVLQFKESLSFSFHLLIPKSQIVFGLDFLSAFFVLVILVVALALAFYSYGYFGKETKKPLGIFWFFLNLLVGSLLLVVLARQALFFLIVWEIMSFASFFLVVFEDEKKKVRQAGFIYLAASQIGAVFLLLFFLFLGRGETFAFDKFQSSSFAVFLLAFAGFGIKAGFLPFHVWLPEAHPAAPTPVSALMSGVMIKMGLYGILRSLLFFSPFPACLAFLFIGSGLFSAVLGLIMALGQKDLKRLLAYSSIEQIGIMSMALGLGFLGIDLKIPFLAFLGFAGFFLHLLNHAVFKSLLFLGAGSIYAATASRNLNSLGALFKKMPLTGSAFLVAVLAVCALPPLNGFFSEFLIYLAAFNGLANGSFWALAVLVFLAFIGALTIALFSAAFGALFLGEPRSKMAQEAKESSGFMTVPMLFLAFLAIFLALGFPWVLEFLEPVVSQTAGFSLDGVFPEAAAILQKPLFYIIGWSWLFLAGLFLWFVFRFFYLRRKQLPLAATWDCGYARPTSRMQYSFSSCLQPLLENCFKRPFFRISSGLGYFKKSFPKKGFLKTKAPDFFYQMGYLPLFQKISHLAAKLRWLQHGYLNLYILYIFLTLLFLLLYKLR